MNSSKDDMFSKHLHASYLRSHLLRLPEHYISMETVRTTALYFSIVGLDILGELPATLSLPDLSLTKEDILDHIYSLQIAPFPVNEADEDNNEDVVCGPSYCSDGYCGFLGSTYLGCLPCIEENNSTSMDPRLRLMQGHLAMAYTSLSILLTLGDDLSRVKKESLIKGVRALQRPDGSFGATIDGGSECDMRFVYCACAVSAILQDWSGVDVETVTSFILSCITYEGGLGLLPGAEAHGGSTYCAVASLALLGRLDRLDPGQSKLLLYWCMERQVGGYQGRTAKDPDTCYSFWIGATLHILEKFSLTDIETTREFILTDCQYTEEGGFCKVPDAYPDILHTFYSICWLSMSHETGLNAIDPRLAICTDKVNILTAEEYFATRR